MDSSANLDTLQNVFRSRYLQTLQEFQTPGTHLKDVLPPLARQAVAALRILYQQGFQSLPLAPRLVNYLDSPVVDLLCRYGFTTTLSYELARHGYLEALQWARQQGCPWDEDTCAYAARGGHLEVLQWARQQGCPWDKWTCADAAQGGHLEVLQWARQQGCRWDVWTCTNAAKGGHLEVLQWARQQGCPWDEETCSHAARGGHLEVLQWAHQQGCPWDESTCIFAAERGHLEVLQWARQQGCPEYPSLSPRRRDPDPLGQISVAGGLSLFANAPTP